jgi:uncharacterized protein
MPKVDEHLPATFSWTDLSTSDYDGAKSFYSGLFGWEVEDLDAGNGNIYGMAKLNGRSVAGLGPLQGGSPGQAMQTGWNAYINVASADEVADSVRKVGGKVLSAPFDVLDVGRMCVIQDPTGAVVCSWEDRGMSGAEVLHEPGTFTWAELMTNDAAKAADFYTKVFGWKATKWDGQLDYTVCKCGDDDVCGMLQMSPEMQGMSPNWMV